MGWQIIVCAISVMYPGLRSIRALISKEGDDDKEWLTYWMIFGVLHFLEMFFGWLLYFIPYWEYVRLLGIAWLMLPQFKGASIVYEKVLKPFCINNKSLITDIIDRTTSEAEILRQKA